MEDDYPGTPISEELLVGALAKIASGWVKRDDKNSGVPFEIATALLALGWIRHGTRTSEGIAKMTWRTWEATPEGLAAHAGLAALSG